MDGSQHRHAGSGSFLSGIGLPPAHFTHHDDVRIKTERIVQEVGLVNALSVMSLSRVRGMDDRIDHLAVLFPHQCQLTEPFSMV